MKFECEIFKYWMYRATISINDVHNINLKTNYFSFKVTCLLWFYDFNLLIQIQTKTVYLIQTVTQTENNK